jgi:hypothetical protein
VRSVEVVVAGLQGVEDVLAALGGGVDHGADRALELPGDAPAGGAPQVCVAEAAGQAVDAEPARLGRGARERGPIGGDERGAIRRGAHPDSGVRELGVEGFDAESQLVVEVSPAAAPTGPCAGARAWRVARAVSARSSRTTAGAQRYRGGGHEAERAHDSCSGARAASVRSPVKVARRCSSSPARSSGRRSPRGSIAWASSTRGCRCTGSRSRSRTTSTWPACRARRGARRSPTSPTRARSWSSA